MKTNQVINVEKALAEKKDMQAEYLREHLSLSCSGTTNRTL